MGENSLTVSKRNFGIDLLRIVSMLMIVVLHMLGHGGALYEPVQLSKRYIFFWFLEIACYSAVDCYALISGYVGCKSKFKYSNIGYIWLQTVFYSVTVAGVFLLLSKTDMQHFKDSFTPVLNNGYWYFTAYFCMFFFIPAFNAVIDNLSDKQLKVLGLTMIGLFSVMPVIAERELFGTGSGYSALWLGILYVLGGIIRKTGFLQNVKTVYLFIAYFAFTVIVWLEKILIEKHNTVVPAEEAVRVPALNYTTPLVLATAVVLLIGFSKLRVKKISAKIIAFFAPLTFGVYLIHDNNLFREIVVKNSFVGIDSFVEQIFRIGIAVVVIFLGCSLVDWVRSKLFELLRIRKMLAQLEEKIAGQLWGK